MFLPVHKRFKELSTFVTEVRVVRKCETAVKVMCRDDVEREVNHAYELGQTGVPVTDVRPSPVDVRRKMFGDSDAVARDERVGTGCPQAAYEFSLFGNLVGR